MALKLGTNSLYKYIPLTNFPVTDIWMDHYYNVITISTCPFSEYDVLHNKLEAESKVSTRFRDPRPKAQGCSVPSEARECRDHWDEGSK